MDYSYLYSTRIEKSFDEDQAEIVSTLRDALHKTPDLTVKLINYCKGMPVSYPARLISVDKHNLEVDVYPQQAVVMSDCRHTFIRCDVLKHDLHAHVQYVNVKRRAATLGKLQYVDLLAERRDYLRLDLAKPQHAHFMTPEGIVKGELVELSLIGARIRVNQACSLQIGDEVTIVFMLQNIAQNLNYNVGTPARLIKVHGDALPKYYSFATEPDKIVDRQIAQYIIQRQIEIVREIKDACDYS